MKKIIAIILVLALSLSVFTGCTLVEKNENKVTSQAVVTIGEGEYARSVSVNDIVSTYNSVAYIYINYYGMSASDALSYIMDSMVSQQVVIYGALNEMQQVNDSDILIEKYLTSEEIAEVKAEVDSAISAEIDKLEVTALQTAYKENGGTLDTIASRTTPSWAKTTSVVPVDFKGTDSREKAYAEFEKTTKASGFTFEETYDMMYESYLENKLSAKFQDQLTADFALSTADITAKYNAQYADEIEYNSAYGEEEFMKKFDADNSVIIYNPTGTQMGYVKQILVKFTEEEAAQLKDLEGEALDAKRLELAKATIATDMRDAYLYKYGYDKAENGLFSKYDFNGTVTPETVDGVQVKDEQGNFAYSAVAPTEYAGYEAFLSSVVNPYLGGTVAGNANGFDIYKSAFDLEKFDNLMFAYNEDTGVMSKTNGYLVPDKDFYEEFNVASEALFAYGAGSYTISLTDYGFHIIYLTKVVSADEKNAFVEADMNKAGTFSYDFAKIANETAKSAYKSEKVAEINEKYNNDEYVVIGEEAYQEMIARLSSK